MGPNGLNLPQTLVFEIKIWYFGLIFGPGNPLSMYVVTKCNFFSFSNLKKKNISWKISRFYNFSFFSTINISKHVLINWHPYHHAAISCRPDIFKVQCAPHFVPISNVFIDWRFSCHVRKNFTTCFLVRNFFWRTRYLRCVVYLFGRRFVIVKPSYVYGVRDYGKSH